MGKSGERWAYALLRVTHQVFREPLSIEDNDVGLARTVWGREDCY